MNRRNIHQIILTQDDVTDLITMDECIKAVEDAFREYAEGRAEMPPKVYLDLGSGDLRAMPASLLGYAGVKWVNSHPENRKVGLPTVMALLILNDPSTGFPLAVMDATHITNMRTGAAGGVAAKYLARKDSRVVGFVGCGTQALFQLDALSRLFDIELVKFCDLSKEAEKKFERYCKDSGLECTARDIRDVCKCDILVTTTPSRDPVVKGEWIEDGVHINAIGADAAGKQELDFEILKRAKIVVDDLEQAVHGGEINKAVAMGLMSANDVYATLGEIVSGRKPGREGDEEITIFDSTGLAIQDISVSKIVYEKAVEFGKGRTLRFFRV